MFQEIRKLISRITVYLYIRKIKICRIKAVKSGSAIKVRIVNDPVFRQFENQKHKTISDSEMKACCYMYNVFFIKLITFHSLTMI